MCVLPGGGENREVGEFAEGLGAQSLGAVMAYFIHKPTRAYLCRRARGGEDEAVVLLLWNQAQVPSRHLQSEFMIVSMFAMSMDEYLYASQFVITVTSKCAQMEHRTREETPSSHPRHLSVDPSACLSVSKEFIQIAKAIFRISISVGVHG